MTDTCPRVRAACSSPSRCRPSHATRSHPLVDDGPGSRRPRRSRRSLGSSRRAPPDDQVHRPRRRIGARSRGRRAGRRGRGDRGVRRGDPGRGRLPERGSAAGDLAGCRAGSRRAVGGGGDRRGRAGRHRLREVRPPVPGPSHRCPGRRDPLRRGRGPASGGGIATGGAPASGQRSSCSSRRSREAAGRHATCPSGRPAWEAPA